MNLEPENAPQSPSPDPLDQLLSEARWPAPTPTQQIRVAKRWDAVWHDQRRHERLAFRAVVLGIAATLLVGVVLGWTWLKRGMTDVQPPMTAQQPDSPKEPDHSNSIVKGTVKHGLAPRKALRALPPSPPIDGVALAAARKRRLAAFQERQIVSRPPTPLEEMLVMANVRRAPNGQEPPVDQSPSAEPPKTRAIVGVRPSKPQPARAPRAKPKEDPAALAVAKLVANPKANPAEVAAALRITANVNESRLAAILANGSPAERQAALKLFGEVGSLRVVPDLLRSAADAQLHAAAIRALSRIADSTTIEQLAHEEPSKDLQHVLLAALLGRGDVESVRLYLNNVANEFTAETALAAAEQTTNPPMDLLFAALRSPSELERLAAARVLGRIDGPATTERLIALLEEGSSRQEACVALLTSRGPEAVNFVNSARTNPALAAALQAASLLASTNSPPRS
jgi:hypothetical protein